MTYYGYFYENKKFSPNTGIQGFIISVMIYYMYTGMFLQIWSL